MSKISNISRAQRQMLIKRHLLQLRLSEPFYKQMYRERMKAYTKFSNKASKLNVEDLPDYVPILYTDNIEPILKNLYIMEAKVLGASMFTQKSDDVWWQNVIRWIERYTGEKIVIIQGTVKDQLVQYLNKVLQEDIVEHGGIEKTTREVLQQCRSYWKDAQKWQVRRIVQTEAMEAGAVGSIEAVNSLDIEYEKVWACSFRNSREDHVLMDGITIGQNEVFNMPNGDKMKYAHDCTLGAQAINLINCSCDTLYNPI